MIRDDFFNDPERGYSQIANQYVFSNTWGRVEEYEKTYHVSLDEPLTREQYVHLLSFITGRASNFRNCKATVRAYVAYLAEKGKLPYVQERIVKSIDAEDLHALDPENGVRYFRNISELYMMTQKTVQFSLKDPDEAHAHDAAVAALLLAWYGLTMEEALEFKKCDVLDDSLVIRGKEVTPPEDVMSFLRRFCDSAGFYKRTSSRGFFAYKPSVFLLRSRKSEKLTVNALKCALNRLNSLNDGRYSLTYTVARQSGIFYRAYLLECRSLKFDLRSPAFASQVFCENLSDRVRREDRISDYGLYKKMFHARVK